MIPSVTAALTVVATLLGAPTAKADDAAALEEVRLAWMKPSTVAAPAPIARDGVAGRVLCGYQGWFNAEGDGADLGWRHWRVADREAPTGSRLSVDLLPDMRELAADERFASDLVGADGKPVELFSSHRRATVLRHFEWMREHAIDGVFVQRFAVGLRHAKRLAHGTKVLGDCRDGALLNGRVYAVMYDLSGMKRGTLDAVVEDWRHLRTRMAIGADAAALRFAGKPLVAVWGIGFKDGRDYTLEECRDLVAALMNGRVYAVMYDLSGMKRGTLDAVVEDWRHLRSRMGIGADAASLQFAGKPLVAVWGIGFKDGRDYTLEECRDLVAALKADGCAVLCGVPTGWRTLDRDAVADPLLHEIVGLCDIVCPWTVGRYRTPEEATRHAERVWRADLAWCRERGIGYLPVVFPGFSWHNLKGGALDQIPRLGGRFLWSQAVGAKRAGAEGAYVAMFDEVDEGTAIFKCIDPPTPELAKRFVGLEGLPSDHYLRLTGEIGRLLRGERPASDDPPAAKPNGRAVAPSVPGP